MKPIHNEKEPAATLPSLFTPDDYYVRRATHFDNLRIAGNDIVMLGDSLINGCEWHELLSNPHIKNRGINGDTVTGVAHRLASALEGEPRKLFIMVGINDVSHNIPADEIARDIITLADEAHHLAPSTELYIHSLLPFDTSIHYTSLQGKEGVVIEINRLLQHGASTHHYTYIDLYPHFVNPHSDIIHSLYTNDGLHLTGKGYELWRSIIKPYIDKD